MTTLRSLRLSVTAKNGPDREDLFDANRLVELGLLREFTFEVTDDSGKLEFCNRWGNWSSRAEVRFEGSVRYCEPLDEKGRKWRIKLRFSMKFLEHANGVTGGFMDTIETLIDYDVHSRTGKPHDRRFISKFMRWIDPVEGRIDGGLYFNGQRIARLAEPKPPHETVLRFPVEELELSVRPYNQIKRVGIETVGDLANKTEEQLGVIPNLGKASIDEIKDALKRFGLELKK